MKWLDRELIVCPYICLCTTQKEFNRVAKYLRKDKYEEEPYLHGNAGACVHTYDRNGKVTQVMCLAQEDIDTIDIPVLFAMVVHECVHIWQETKAGIKERDPSPEFEAYSMQALCLRFFVEVMRRRKNA